MYIEDDDFRLDYELLNELSYYDEDDYYIQLFLNKEFVANLKVWSDAEQDDREYIIINHEIIYLDEIKKVN